MSRHDSEDVLGSLLAEGMPDRAAAANLENVPEGEVGGQWHHHHMLAWFFVWCVVVVVVLDSWPCCCGYCRVAIGGGGGGSRCVWMKIGRVRDV